MSEDAVIAEVLDETAELRLPDSWSWQPLAFALRHRKRFVSIEDQQRFKRVRVQLHGRGIVLRDEVKGADLRTKKQQVLEPNDFLVAEIDAKMGGFGIVPPELAGAVVSSHYFTFEVDSDRLRHGYLEAFIRTGYITRQILQHVRGSLNYAAIRPRHVLGIRLPVAPLPIQDRIVADFVAIDRAKAALREQVQLLEALPFSIIRDAMNGGVFHG